MYDKSDKRRLYWLISQYLLGKIDEPFFCDEFYYSYDLEVDSNTLTDIEKVAFAELSQISSRFSQYEEDHKLDSKAFSTVEELKQKIIETKEKLKGQNL
ncbi:hypothetical protein [Flavobacterium sp. WV_118_3]|uniref:hypothetical protein n=1 Tax=Flavobacterium sp. WV_118_3 TaxID=3151764 RepID=UPI003219BDCB